MVVWSFLKRCQKGAHGGRSTLRFLGPVTRNHTHHSRGPSEIKTELPILFPEIVSLSHPLYEGQKSKVVKKYGVGYHWTSTNVRDFLLERKTSHLGNRAHPCLRTTEKEKEKRTSNLVLRLCRFLSYVFSSCLFRSRTTCILTFYLRIYLPSWFLQNLSLLQPFRWGGKTHTLGPEWTFNKYGQIGICQTGSETFDLLYTLPNL